MNSNNNKVCKCARKSKFLQDKKLIMFTHDFLVGKKRRKTYNQST